MLTWYSSTYSQDRLAKPLYIEQFYQKLDKFSRELKTVDMHHPSEERRLDNRRVDEELKGESKKMKGGKDKSNPKRPQKFDDKIFDGLKDEDREKTEYLDESMLSLRSGCRDHSEP